MTSSVVFTSAKIRAIVPEFGLVGGPIDFGHGIADHDHPIIEFDPTSDGRRQADASGHPASDAGGNTHIAENRIEGGVRAAAKAFQRPNARPPGALVDQ